MVKDLYNELRIVVIGSVFSTSLLLKKLYDYDYRNVLVYGHTKTVDQLVLKQVALIKKSGAAGCVCSAREAKLIRKRYKNLFIVTPGIRLPGDKTNDQARVETPAKAFSNKVSAIVMGRSLVSGKIKDNLKRLINHLN